MTIRWTRLTWSEAQKAFIPVIDSGYAQRSLFCSLSMRGHWTQIATQCQEYEQSRLVIWNNS